MQTKKLIVFPSCLFLFILFSLTLNPLQKVFAKKPIATKLYWFIPDGTRADDERFNIFQWAQEGQLPHIKKMMENGAYGYSIPVYPTNSPSNYASLMTGSYPEIHGITNAAIYIDGTSLQHPSAGGFRSASRKVPAIWSVLEQAGKKVVLVSIPGSTPPELKKGVTIRGRKMGGGKNSEAVIFESESKLRERNLYRYKVIFTLPFEPSLPLPVNQSKVEKLFPEKSFSDALQSKLDAYGLSLYAYIYDTTDDGKTNYDRILFLTDKTGRIADLTQGEWSPWIPVELKAGKIVFDSHLKIKIIKLWSDGAFRIRVFYNNMNRLNTFPSEEAEEIVQNLGPMADVTDLWAGLLNHEPEDKETFLEEAQMTFQWHKKAIPFLYKRYQPDIFLQEIFIPNAMLESRWWLGKVDPERKGLSDEEKKDSWKDILWTYRQLDDLLGEAIKNSDPNTLIVLSSDHGMAPLQRTLNVNNFFAKKGWLKFSIDPKSNNPKIDWTHTKAIFVRSGYIYINPKGLDGPLMRGQGAEYLALRQEVIQSLKNLSDTDGSSPFKQVLPREDACQQFHLPADRIGDIVIVNQEEFDTSENMDKEMILFSEPLKTGHKNAVDPQEKSVRTPFIIMGPGVKKGYALKEPIQHIDQMPTLLHLLRIPIPDYVQGRILTEIEENMQNLR